MNIITDRDSWFLPHAEKLAAELAGAGNAVRLHHEPGPHIGGDVCFLLSCSRILGGEQLARHENNIVVHASDLPQGKGMSPVTWQILEGKDRIPICLLEAVDTLDSGPIYLRDELVFRGNELIDEIRRVQAEVTIDLCRRFIDGYPRILEQAVSQEGRGATYPRRSPEDSRIDPERTIAEQFDLLRTVDDERYPAFFDYRGRRFRISINAVE